MFITFHMMNFSKKVVIIKMQIVYEEMKTI
jgi:hypothetical protein